MVEIDIYKRKNFEWSLMEHFDLMGPNEQVETEERLKRLADDVVKHRRLVRRFIRENRNDMLAEYKQKLNSVYDDLQHCLDLLINDDVGKNHKT